MKSFWNIFKHIGLDYIVAIVGVVAAASLRIWPLDSLELRIPWLTFYPAVILAGVYGGLFPGLMATALTVFVVGNWSPTDQPFLKDSVDWLGAAVFTVNCSFISAITEAMRRAQKRATQAKEEAEAANRAKTVFLANMSHELRTPLNAILGFSRLMCTDANINPEQKENLDIIVRSGEHLLRLINNVLDISKIETGHIELEKAQLDLHDLLYELHSLLNIQALEKHLDFKLVLDEKLPRFVQMDGGKLLQVLTNLVGNAIKFTQQGSVTLRAELSSQTTENQCWLYFSVSDTGTGISAENLQRLFLPFVQLEQQIPQNSGTGLGLAISQQFVQLMHGTLHLNSKPGQGSVFHFEIPVNLSANIDQENAKTDKCTQVVGLKAAQKPYRLLIAEDHAENRLLLHKLLQPLGFELSDALNGQEAIALCQSWRPDLIFMDIRMPVMNGLEATRCIRADSNLADIPIVALTAHALEEERLEILQAGCDDFIRKPYRQSDIFNALNRHLHIRFRYGQTTPDTNLESLDESDIAELSKLPINLLLELRKAVELLDQDACLNSAGCISDINGALGLKLRQQIEALRYKELLVILDQLIGAQP